jgi:hypothetical protein
MMFMSFIFSLNISHMKCKFVQTRSNADLGFCAPDPEFLISFFGAIEYP